MRQPSLYLRQQWRTNTVGVGALAAVVVLTLALFFGGSLFGGSHASTRSAQDYDYRLAHDPIALNGTREKLFVLERWITGWGGPSGASVNVLIVDSDDASSRWMFPDNGQTILTRDELHANDGALAPVTGLVLTVTNASGESQRESLYYWRVGGGPAVRFLTADTVVSADQAGPDRYLVVYRNGVRTLAAVYSLIDFNVMAQKPAPEVPQ